MVSKRFYKQALAIVMLALAAAGAVYLSLEPGDAAKSKPGSQQPQGDTFTGTILNRPLEGKVEGVILADLDCKGSMTAITCIAIVDSTTGQLEFKYTHNMEKEPCLSPGERVIVEASQGSDRAFVKRLG